MTKLLFNTAGACGFPVAITVHKNEDNTLNVKISSGCEMVVELGNRINGRTWRKGIFGKLLQSSVYTEANECIKHVTCPIPSGLLKAIEVEVGAAIPNDVVMKFSSANNEE